jgi:hypothetical protein
MDRVSNVAGDQSGDQLSLSAPNGENGSTPRLAAPSPPVKDSPALLELEGSLSRDSLQSGGHSSEAVDTGSEGVYVSLFYLSVGIVRVPDPDPITRLSGFTYLLLVESYQVRHVGL